MRSTILHGSCEAHLRTLADNSIDAVVTDPPAGIGFMGRTWDSDKGGRDQWIAWLAGVMRECLRVLRPGGYALVWALPRTSHWTATAIEDAGFEIRDVHHHIFGSGMPKSLDMERQFDMHFCDRDGRHYDKTLPKGAKARPGDHLCPPADRRWLGDGMYTALKPAVEHWVLARKPLVGTYAENVLEHGTGALRIDACRIGTERTVTHRRGHSGDHGVYNNDARLGTFEHDALGRWPAHLSLEHSDGCRVVGERVEERASLLRAGDRKSALGGLTEGSRRVGTAPVKQEIYDCVEGCPVRTLDEQSGERKAGERPARGARRPDGSGWGMGPPSGERIVLDSGGASRFFHTVGNEPGFRYIAKPARSEKDRGLEDLPAIDGGAATGRAEGSAGLKSPRAGSGRNGGGRNTHPTVKAIALMRWLVRLITPPGGLVLDPFAGSGTTGVACAEEGLRFLGIEQDEKHHETARLRLRKAYGAAEVATELPAQRDIAAVLIAQPKGGEA